MDNLTIKYSTYAQMREPQPIRMANVPWAGESQKMEDGSEPQPWHCMPFVEGSTHGLEFIYPYEKECQVIAENGTIRFDWDFAGEPGNVLTGGEFRAFAPLHASEYYAFSTRVDVQPPPGYVLRTEPHPRYFTDRTGTVPLAMIGHLQNEWYPRMVFVVFRAPPQGQRHVFRKGEPFVQIIFVPQRLKYEMVKMSAEEAGQRRDLEQAIEAARLDFADNVWHNPAGSVFSNYYKVLARAFARDGISGVREVVEKAVERWERSFPRDKTIAECMAMGAQCMRELKYEHAEEIYTHVLSRDPNNAAAYSAMGVCFDSVGNFKNALKSMKQAVALQPRSANYRTNLGELLRRQGRLAEAEASFQSALLLTPKDPEVLSVLGLTLAQQGRLPEALESYRAALATGVPLPPAHLGIGMIMAQQGRHAEARACYEAALAIAPGFTPARQALEELPAS
ncbi:MAG TPA: tetratricopeptide repeat protein [Gemmataceae bacterium]|jgi:Flp pilus assembly protein TadD|nr:tetratricopeptide repeat protein [Gemmataceae bacterium]